MVTSVLEKGKQAVLDFDRLESECETFRKHYFVATPFKHVVIDDFFARDDALLAADAFPRFRKTTLARLFGARVYGAKLDAPAPALERLFSAVQSARFTRWLEAITGIPDLRPDFELAGAGVHQGANGSDLHVHADHNTHPSDRSLFRRVNVLVYLNPDWKPSWNGDLQLWDREALECRERISPAFNRCVIMEVHDRAFHGYDRLRIPSGQTRRSIATYFYSTIPGFSQAAAPHGTLFPRLQTHDALASAARTLRRKLLHRIEKTMRGFGKLRLSR